MRIKIDKSTFKYINRMSVKYKVMSTYKPGAGQDGKQMWFPKLTGSKQVDLYDVAQILEKRSAASKADVQLIIYGLIDLIPELLIQGKTVKLAELGSFRLHARVNPADEPEKVSSKNIRELHISFRPDKRMKMALRQAQFVKV